MLHASDFNSTSKNFYRSSTLFGLILVFLVTLKTHKTYMGQGDEPHYMMITESLLLDQDLDLKNNYQSPHLRHINDPHVVKKSDGRDFPFHGLGLPILGLPVMAVAYGVKTFVKPRTQVESWVLVKNTFSYVIMITAAFLGVLLFKIFLFFWENKAWAWWTAALFSLSPPLLSYGYLFFTELPAALFLTYLYFCYLRKKEFRPLEALAIGFLPWLHIRYALVAGAILTGRFFQGVFFLKKPTVMSSFYQAGLVVLLWAGLLGVNYHMWGGVTPEKSPLVPSLFWVAIPGLFWDRASGLFIFGPMYALFPSGWAFLWKKNRSWALMLLLLVFMTVIPVVGFTMWWGGWSPGPRYLVPALPLLALCVYLVVMNTVTKKPGRIVMKGLYTLIGVLSLLYWQNPRYLWNPERMGVNEFFTNWFGPLGQAIANLFPDFFQPFPYPQLHMGFLTLILLLLNGVLYLALRSLPQGPLSELT